MEIYPTFSLTEKETRSARCHISAASLSLAEYSLFHGGVDERVTGCCPHLKPPEDPGLAAELPSDLGLQVLLSGELMEGVWVAPAFFTDAHQPGFVLQKLR